MKKTIAFILAAIMLALCLCSCGKTEKTFSVGFDAEFPPYGFIAADGSYDGFDLALAKEVCNRLGWTFKAVPIDWSQKDFDLSSGTIDCIWNGFTRNGREEDYTWSDAYVDNSIVVVTLASSKINTLADLAGKTVMVQEASSGFDAISEKTGLLSSFKSLITLPDYGKGFIELNQGSVDAVIVDLGVAKYQMNLEGGDYRILDETVSNEQYAIGFLLGNTELRDTVNGVLLKMAEDGTMAEIAAKYEDAGLVPDSLCLCK